MDARRQAVTERLRAREAVRKKIDDESENNSRKDEHVIDKFAADFARCKSRIEALLSSCDGADGATKIEARDTSSQLDTLYAELRAAQKLVSDAQLFLPAYDKQLANKTLGNLETALNDRREKLVPKKKFAFRTRKQESSNTASGDITNDVTTRQPELLNEQHAQRQHRELLDSVNSACDYHDMSSATLTECSAGVVNGKDVSLHNLRDCRVRICGAPSTVHVSRLIDCVVLLGPVATSVFVDDCNRLTMAVACQQLRIHATKQSDFYVQVTSRSIIEDSTGLRFAPFGWRYDGIDEHYKLSGLDRNPDKSGRWNAVDDFDWLVSGKASPNWSPMDEKDRQKFD